MTRPQRAVSSPSIEPGPLSKRQSNDCWNCKLSTDRYQRPLPCWLPLVQPTALWKTAQKHRKQSMRKPLLNVEKDMKCHSYSDDTQNNSRVPIYWNLLLFESCLFLWDSLNFPGAGNKIPRGYWELHSEHFQSLNAVGIKTFSLMHLNKPC